jgi:hypothetical protein
MAILETCQGHQKTIENLKRHTAMNEKDNNQIPSFSDPINWKSLGFFSAEDYLIYVFKKTEKITSALYLVSSLLKDEEPIKWELRDKGMDLLSSSFTASSAVPGDKNAVIQSIFTAALETLSLLNVAQISHLISEMNHRILVREIDGVISLLKDRLTANAESAGYVLSEQFFKTPDLFSSGFKGQSQEQSKIAPRKENPQGQKDNSLKKTSRQDAIVTILKGQSNLTIKDFSKVIKDCSEKTIQRELLELVDKGVVKKEGERRWSRYSLK